MPFNGKTVGSIAEFQEPTDAAGSKTRLARDTRVAVAKVSLPAVRHHEAVDFVLRDEVKFVRPQLPDLMDLLGELTV